MVRTTDKDKERDKDRDSKDSKHRKQSEIISPKFSKDDIYTVSYTSSTIHLKKHLTSTPYSPVCH